ncbi:PAS domain-containing hybrid sensor histidine kinase/response regulator [Geothrix oryzisoli]|uniref:PAS domain-containing hybrid sensor histidine kinase/response regulator n=1 Tax=Geothrix oryzisoli TaxID=2922721 RepID=UPI001FADF65D|nr:response regulator [Geothrix oryzisoli]
MSSFDAFQELFRRHPVPMWIYDLETLKFLEVNEAACQTYGYDRSAFLALTLRDIRPPEDVRLLEGNVAQGRPPFQRSGTWRHITRTGRILQVEITSHALPFEGREAALVMARDVTDRQTEEQELQRSLVRLGQARRLARLVTWDYDLLAKRLEWPDEAMEILGCQGQAPVRRARDYMALVHPEDRDWVQAWIQKALGGEANFDFEHRVLLDSGVERILHLSAEVIRDGHGRPAHLWGVAQDVTEARRRLMADLQSQKLESLGLLAGGIVHDFNNLLTAMLANFQLAAATIPEDSPAHRHLRLAAAAAEKSALLTSQLLGYSGKGRFHVRPLDLNQAAREVLDMLRSSLGSRTELHLHLEEGLPPVLGDPAQIQQVLLNLVTNASEALEGKPGSIRITTQSAKLDPAYIQGTFAPSDQVTPGPYVCFQISDTGCGIPPDRLGRIFDPFFTTKVKGRGLGLSAILGIIRSHGGVLKVYSEEGRGTNFRIFLPASSRVLPAPGTEPVPEGAGAVGGWVLVVDDDDLVRATARGVLEREGFEVMEAPDGGSCLEALRNHPGRFRLVLMDLTMPGMDGVETYQALRTLDPEVQVVLTSGYNEQEAINRFVQGDLAGFIQKPFSAGDLARRVREALVKA